YQGNSTGLAEDAMPALILEATGADVGDFIERYAEGREDIPLGPLFAEQGIALHWEAATTLPSLDARLRATNGQTQLATVYEGGAAHRAGLSAGDALLAIGGLKADTPATIDKLLAAYRPGDTVGVHVFRRDELREFQVRLGKP